MTAAELTAWLDLRGAEAAAEELLQTATAGSAADRLFATVLATCGAAEPQRPQELLDVMRRLPHPDIIEVLALARDHHPDKKVAKAVRMAMILPRLSSPPSSSAPPLPMRFDPYSRFWPI